METKIYILHLLVLDERFMNLDKNPLRIFKCKNIKNLSGFAQMSILVKAD
jgi:hypothetical protein